LRRTVNIEKNQNPGLLKGARHESTTCPIVEQAPRGRTSKTGPREKKRKVVGGKNKLNPLEPGREMPEFKNSFSEKNEMSLVRGRTNKRKLRKSNKKRQNGRRRR